MTSDGPMFSDGLVEALQAVLGAEGRRVVAATATLSPYSSSFRIESITVGFADGDRARVVRKDLSWATMLDGARAVRQPDAHDPTREIEVYRRLLGRAPAGAPRLVGWFHDHDTERHWLFLEHVEGPQLRHVGDIDAWRQAAAWAGRLHRCYAGAQEVDGDTALLPAWTATKLRRALHGAARRVSRHGTRRARWAMAEVARHHEAVVGRLLAAPLTLVHGQLYPSNVLVRARAADRICVVDWETAARGPGVLDLAALVEGDWDESVRDDLCRAYLSGRDGAASAAGLRALRDELVCARVQLCLEILALPQGFKPPEDHAADWAARAARLTGELAA